jgi:hypothetical protein
MKAILFLIWLFLISLVVAGIYLVVTGNTLWGWFLIIVALCLRVTYTE